MKRWLMVIATICFAGSVSATYVSPLWETGGGDPWGAIDLEPNWPGSVYPSGSTTGLLSSATLSAWVGGSFLQDIAVRDESGAQVNFIGDTALRGGSSGSGITTIYEIEDLNNPGFANTNLNCDTALTLWSQYNEKMELSILSGRVETPLLNIPAWGYGTINMRDGILHAVTNAYDGAQFNMLAGGTGNITIDGVAYDVFDVNFESGNEGSFTIGSKLGGPAGGVWEYAIDNSRIAVNGVISTNQANYYITSTDGTNQTIALRTDIDIDGYDLFLGMTTNTMDAVGGWQDPAMYESGTLPDGITSTGLIGQVNNVWEGDSFIHDFGCRSLGGTIVSVGETALRGGATPSGKTLVEFDAPDYATTVNWQVNDSLTLWSEYGGDIELNILRGTVEVATNLNLLSGGNGTINMGDGLLHAAAWGGGAANVNMLAGRDGDIVIDDMNGIGANNLYLNFEDGNEGSFTFGRLTNGVPAGGTWEWMVLNGNVSIDGSTLTDTNLFDITSTDGTNQTISLPGPLGKLDYYQVWVGGFGLTGSDTDMDADPDGDGVPNLSEYGMLGDPNNSAVQGTVPLSYITDVGGIDYLVHAHYERKDQVEKGLSYSVDQALDLITGTWTNDTMFVYGSGSHNTEFNVITNVIPADTENKQFMRLRVEFSE